MSAFRWSDVITQVNDTFVPEAAKLAGGEDAILDCRIQQNRYSSSTPGLPEERADGPTTTFKPSGSTTFLQVQSSSMPLSTTSCECHIGCAMSRDLHVENSAPSSDLPSATNTEVPKSKTPVGAIAGGKSPIPTPTPS